MSRRSAAEQLKKARRRKLLLLLPLVAAFALVWGRALLPSSPRPAGAETDEVTASSSAAPETSGAAPVQLPWPVVMSRDPFTIDRTAYALRPVDEEPVLEEPEPEPEIEDPAPDPAEEARKSLVLQATVQGDDPSAMINDRLLRVGDTVQGFTIISIGDRRVTLRRDGVDVTLDM